MDDKFKSVDRFQHALSNLMQVDRDNFRQVIEGCLNPTPRERHLTYNYHRAAINAEMLVSITDTKQFQAMTMLTRAIFEISVEMRTILNDKDAAEKIEVFNNIERLRAATKLVEYTKHHSDAPVHSETYKNFLKANEATIRREQKRIWPNEKMSDVQHWTLKQLPQRAEVLGGVFKQIYHVSYSELSWYVHGGTAGVINLGTNAFAYLAGICYKVSADAYSEILETLIREFRLECADDIVRIRIHHARFDPFAETPAEKAALLKAMGVELKQPNTSA